MDCIPNPMLFGKVLHCRNFIKPYFQGYTKTMLVLLCTCQENLSCPIFILKCWTLQLFSVILLLYTFIFVAFPFICWKKVWEFAKLYKTNENFKIFSNGHVIEHVALFGQPGTTVHTCGKLCFFQLFFFLGLNSWGRLWHEYYFWGLKFMPELGTY